MFWVGTPVTPCHDFPQHVVDHRESVPYFSALSLSQDIHSGGFDGKSESITEIVEQGIKSSGSEISRLPHECIVLTSRHVPGLNSNEFTNLSYL